LAPFLSFATPPAIPADQPAKLAPDQFRVGHRDDRLHFHDFSRDGDLVQGAEDGLILLGEIEDGAGEGNRTLITIPSCIAHRCR
jgi:hypothetical protein